MLLSLVLGPGGVTVSGPGPWGKAHQCFMRGGEGGGGGGQPILRDVTPNLRHSAAQNPACRAVILNFVALWVPQIFNGILFTLGFKLVGGRGEGGL